jgi:GTP-binding protein
MITGKRLRIYYMVQVEVAPPKFIFFVNRAALMTEAYKKYLQNQFRKSYRFAGVPLLFELRSKRVRDVGSRVGSLLSERVL